MSSFAESGYLSTEMDNYVKEIRHRYSEWLDFIGSINRFSQELQYRLRVDQTDPQSLVCATLYIRTLSTFQAAVFISERGMVPQAQMLLRCMLESVFSLVAISRDENMAKRFIIADAKNRRMMLDKVQSWGKPLREVTGLGDTDLIRQKIEQDIEQTDAKLISAKDMAVKAELYDWYLTAYPILSGSIHASIRDLESHLLTDKARNIVGLVNEPRMERLNELFLTAAEAMLIVLQALEKVFKVDTSQFVKPCYEQLGALVKATE